MNILSIWKENDNYLEGQVLVPMHRMFVVE